MHNSLPTNFKLSKKLTKIYFSLFTIKIVAILNLMADITSNMAHVLIFNDCITADNV